MPSAAAGLKRKAKVYDSPEELNLVHRAKKGDESAFNVLYEIHQQRVRITINRIVKDEDTSSWIANIALTKVWENLRGWSKRNGKRVRMPGFDEQSKFSTWITRIAINEALMHIRKEKNQHRDAESAALDVLLSPQGGTNTGGDILAGDGRKNALVLARRDLDLEGIADRQVLDMAINRVPASFRVVLVLRYWEGHSLMEIRKKLRKDYQERVTIPALKSRLLRGRLILKAQVQRIS